MKRSNLTTQMELAVRCTTCGAASGQPCELSSGGLRNTPHRDRSFAAADAAQISVKIKPATA